MFGLQYFLSKVPMLDLVSDAPNYRTISTITALRRRLNYTILDTSFGQDTSVGHLQFLTLHWLNRYQIRYMMLSTTT